MVADAMGNVAKTATLNVFTPIPKGTFLAGITRARHIDNLRRNGGAAHARALGFEDFRTAGDVFRREKMTKITPLTVFDDRKSQVGRLTRRTRELYWERALSAL